MVPSTEAPRSSSNRTRKALLFTTTPFSKREPRIWPVTWLDLSLLMDTRGPHSRGTGSTGRSHRAFRENTWIEKFRHVVMSEPRADRQTSFDAKA